MDFYSASGIPILWCCFFQTIAIGWIFGATKFSNCVEQMTGYKPHAYWWWTWAVVAPAVMGVSDSSRIHLLVNIGHNQKFVCFSKFIFFYFRSSLFSIACNGFQ